MKEENQAIIKALNMYGRVPKHWELLNEIEKLSNIIYDIRDRLKQITQTYRPNSTSSLYFTVKRLAYDDLDKILNELNIKNKSVFDYAYKLEEENKQLKSQLQQEKNKIKEVREYIEKCSILGVNEVDSYCMDYDVRDDLLKILDKEEN